MARISFPSVFKIPFRIRIVVIESNAGGRPESIGVIEAEPLQTPVMISKVLLLFSFSAFVSSIASPHDLPIYAKLHQCVQYALGGPGVPCFFNYCDLFSGIGCQSYICACNRFSNSANQVSSLAAKSCSRTDTSDIATATSFWKEFCLGLLATTPRVPLTPTNHPPQCTIPVD
jgi:hypothetical protein